MITRRLYRALDARLGTTSAGRTALAKVFPDHWTFMFGEVAVYAFLALLLTGTYLTLFFEPSTAETVYDGAYQPLDGSTVSSAFASTVALSFDVRAGLLMRQAHHWAALLFVAAIVVHLLRVFFTGAFRRPRELNWVVGVTMLALALLNGFTGYSMPDDLLSGTGLRIIYSTVLSVPVVGSWIAMLAFGGEFPSDETTPRLYISHVLIVPAVFLALISLHLVMIIRQKHSQFPGPGRREHNVVGSRLWPAYAVRSLSLLTGVLAAVFALGGLVQINPVWIYGPFHPAQATSPAQPDWYVAWGDGALRLFPPIEVHVAGHLIPAPFFPAVGLGTVTFLLLYAWPWLERWRTGDKASHQILERPRDRPGRVAAGAYALTFFAVLLVAAADDIIARLSGIPVLGILRTLQILLLVLPFAVAAVAFLVARSLRAGTATTVGELTRADLHAGMTGPAASPGDTDHPAERIRLWRNPDDTWRWRWHGPGADLASNEVFLDREGALDAARTAYPGVPVEQDEPPEGVVLPPPRREPGPATKVAAALVWVAMAVLGRRADRRQPSRSEASK
ncbi:ubiquinol-cytochrome c reductase cytochrome b subunit [Couchioplanes caeruleus]|uniref:cytochrome bc1 complex cytochrome b subunit n=1 Tax=Couchioplanes caeruleus TaxID=56438 RepID=UPI0020BF10EC|nr:ubiquinol-cytochrome c reductase cytochrome b subunit [Couchioplanes caeruleus]UQU62614.1 ubiquinol-cytochrome c reductase cytochrome b subunit [Couchioplanes caeruleus]